MSSDRETELTPEDVSALKELAEWWRSSKVGRRAVIGASAAGIGAALTGGYGAGTAAAEPTGDEGQVGQQSDRVEVWASEIDANDFGDVSANSVTTDQVSIANLGFEAYLSSNQSINNSTFETIVADTEVADDTGDYDTATGQWTTPYNGDYYLRVLVDWFDELADQDRWISQVMVGSNEYRLRDQHSSASNRDIGCRSIHLKDLSAGTSVSFEVYQESGQSLDLRGGTRSDTSISGVYLG